MSTILHYTGFLTAFFVFGIEQIPASTKDKRGKTTNKNAEGDESRECGKEKEVASTNVVAEGKGKAKLDVLDSGELVSNHSECLCIICFIAHVLLFVTCFEKNLSFVQCGRNPAISRTKNASARSPFNERAVRITAKANNVDKELYYWVISTADDNK